MNQTQTATATSARKFPEPQAFTDAPRPPIALQSVQSNQVRAIGYDAETKTCAVTFTRGNGAIYHYSGVEPDQFEAFKRAESIGKHFDAHIRPLDFTKYPAEA